MFVGAYVGASRRHGYARSSSAVLHCFVVRWQYGGNTLHSQNPSCGRRRILGRSASVGGLLYSRRFLGRSHSEGARSDGMPSVESVARRRAVSSREASKEGLCHSGDGARAQNGVTRLPQVDAARLIRALKRGGFLEHESRGSHMTLKHPASGKRTTVPVHGGDVKRGLMKQILKQAGITEEKFRELL